MPHWRQPLLGNEPDRIGMYVCHCNGVTDAAIVGSVAAGARGPDGVGEMCGAGTSCGMCLPLVEEVLADVDGLIGQNPT